MGLESEFHELFHLHEPPKKVRASDKQRLRAAARGSKHRIDQLQQHFNALVRGVEKERPAKAPPVPAMAKPLTDSMSTSQPGPPFLELNCNPSSFAVFSTVRQSVLESKLRRAALIYNQAVQGLAGDDGSDEGDDARSSSLLKVPKVVGLGLCVVFELIRESRLNNPSLSSRALHALLDTLQGQVPEGLKKEPPDVTDPLFDLLLDLASTPFQPSETETSEAGDSPSESLVPLMKSFACSALLSLVVALGDTGKMLTAVSTLLTSSHLEGEEIETPSILIAMQRSVHAVLLGKTARPDWLTQGFPSSALCDSFPINLQGKNGREEEAIVGEKGTSLAFDGRFLYLLQNNVIFKVGSGYSGTVKGQVVTSRRVAPAKAGVAIGWLGWVKGYLYYQSNNWTKNEVLKLDTESLREVGRVTLGISHWGPSVSASDGDYLIVITATKDDSFTMRTLKPSTSSPQSSNSRASADSSSSSNSSSAYLMPVIHELTLKLAHKCLAVCGGLGGSLFDVSPNGAEANDDQSRGGFKPILIGDEDPAQVCAGKDFAVIRTHSGRVMFTGKNQALGMKHSAGSGSWLDLQISKGPKIFNISVGHEGAHMLLIAEDGSVYFSGLSKRGEDGEHSKGRRQPKASKPKKIAKLEGKQATACACNHGSSAVVTKDGELYMFGKDNAHVEKSTGLVSGLKNVFVAQVALGKAHTLALTDKGHVYAFGFNHKGQCGQDFVQSMPPGAGSLLGQASGGPSKSSDEALSDVQVDISEDVIEPLCAAGNHNWKYDQCMICTSCGECTGYGPGCVASGKSEVRNPGLLGQGPPNAGMPCGCGAGDSGCYDCGICRACDKMTKEVGGNDDDSVEVEAAAALAGLAARPFNAAIVYPGAMGNHPLFDGIHDIGAANGRPQPQAYVALADGPYDLIPQAPHGGRMNDPLKAALDRYQGLRPERRRSALEAHISRKFRYMNRPPRNIGDDIRVGANSHADQAADRLAGNVPSVDEQGAGSDCETNKLTSLPPTKLNIPSRVVQVACGLHHSVLLTDTGEVFTFGSNQQGQLGLGDFVHRERPTKVPVSTPIVQIAAGSNHSLLLTAQGQVYTFGSNQKGQLGRQPSAIDYNWNASPSPVPNVGPQNGRRATWIDATGDYTFVKLDESLINPLTLHSAKVVANSRCIVIAPPTDLVRDARLDDRPFRSLVINRADGSCRTFTQLDQVNLGTFSSMCLDNFYNVLWTFDAEAQIVNRYNVIASEAKALAQISAGQRLRHPTILSPEVALPNKTTVCVSRSNAAFNLLCALHTLTRANQLGLTVQDDEQNKNQVTKTYNKDDFSSVNRFESHGGGWGYSGHSIEAIRFMADADILLGGFGLFGGRGEYMAKLRLYDIGSEGGEQEGDGDILAETEETPYECGARQKYPVLFEEPVLLQANRWYVAWARVSGPSSDCGSSGQSVVNSEDQVTFYFKSSKKSNNGTDVNAGQIPLVMYKLATNAVDTSQCPSPNQCDQSVEPVSVLSRDFSMAVSPECFYSLLKLLRWSWQSFRTNLLELSSAAGQAMDGLLLDLKHLTYVCCASLHLLKVYVNEVFPSVKKRTQSIMYLDSLKLAECVADTRTLMKQILSDNPPSLDGVNTGCEKFADMLIKQILNECHMSFMSCYHAFYPSTTLRWRGLCDLLLSLESPTTAGQRTDSLLAAMLASLCCSPLIRLTQTFPLNQSLDVQSVQSPSDLYSPCGVSNGDFGSSQDPILVEKMLEKSDREGCHTGLECSFRDVLQKLLAIIGQPTECLLLSQRDDLEAPENKSADEVQKPLSPKLVENTCILLSSIISELVAQATGIGFDVHTPVGQTLHVTPSRFSRVSQNRTWNTGNGSPDAICFSVDRSGIMIAGVTVYGGIGNEWHYELELLDYQGSGDQDRSQMDGGQSHQWCQVDIVRGTYSLEEKSPEVAEIKFERPLAVRENAKYSLRLRNHGARTNNGDGGLTHVRGPDGTTFSFSDCSLSFNGTNHTRGQIPQIIYYSSPPTSRTTQSSHRVGDELQSRRNVLAVSEAIVSVAVDLLFQAQGSYARDTIAAISSSHLVNTLLPSVISNLAPIAISDPKSATQILSLVRQLLPLVASANKHMSDCDSGALAGCQSPPPSSPSTRTLVTTSKQYVIVESDHPYKPATVSHYRVLFPPSIKWMAIEFDPRCGTAQPEDALQLFIPSLSRLQQLQKGKHAKPLIDDKAPNADYWPVFKKFSGKPSANSNCWPTSSIVLPGNEILYSLETASDYVKDDKACYYGFRCQIVGYESPADEGLCHLEQELSYLGATCVNSLLSRDLILPPLADDIQIDEMEVTRELQTHTTLLGKGLSLAHLPSAQEALEGVLPLSHEKPFLKDFVYCTPGSSGGRLARWLQPESYADPTQCEVHCTCVSGQELQCGWPTIITVTTKDQYGAIVNVPNLKVDVCAQPFHSNASSNSDKSPKLTKLEENDNLAFGGLPPPQTVPYAVTMKDKMLYHAITMMSAYENYSFEELRFVAPVKKRNVEAMLVRPNTDGTYTANWTPGSAGWYQIKVVIDGVPISANQSVQVGEPPKGIALPQPLPLALPKQGNVRSQPNKIRKFVGRHSAGLRIRALPSLQSEQIGLITANHVVTVSDEIQNDDGIWVRLAPSSVAKYCTAQLSGAYSSNFGEAWCLQYNQHLGRTLLVLAEEENATSAMNGSKDMQVYESNAVQAAPVAPPIVKPKPKRAIFRGPITFPGLFHVVKCGSSGHNVRSRPTLRSPPVGMLVMGNVCTITQEFRNSEGTWYKLGEDAKRRFCFNTDGEAWTLGLTENEVAYLQPEAEVMLIVATDESDSEETRLVAIAQDKVAPVPEKAFERESASANQALDGSFSGKDMSLATLSQSVASESDFGSITSSMGDPVSHSLNTFTEAEKAETESVQSVGSASSATTAGSKVAAYKKLFSDSIAAGVNLAAGKGKEFPSLGVSVKEMVRSLSRDSSPTPDGTPPATPKASRSVSPSSSFLKKRPSLQSASSQTIKSLREMARRRTTSTSDVASSQASQASSSKDTRTSTQMSQSTQTSPPAESSVCMSSPGSFMMGLSTSGQREHSTSPKKGSKSARSKRERPNSPIMVAQPPVSINVSIPLKPPPPTRVPVKEAMSNSVAECLRAVFAAFIWHEGILNDAMAAASFLKFSHNLSKDAVQAERQQFMSRIATTYNPASKETKTKYRHSVEVSQLHAMQSECYANANIDTNNPISEGESTAAEKDIENENEVKPPEIAPEELTEQTIPNESVDEVSATVHERSAIPETLFHLLSMWEETSKSCISALAQPSASVSTPANESPATTPIQMFNRIMPGKSVQSPAEIAPSEPRPNSANPNQQLQGWNPYQPGIPLKVYRPGFGRGLPARQQQIMLRHPERGYVPVNMFGEAAHGAAAGLANGQVEPAREGTSDCELCGQSYPYPVTRHMRQAHPGCREHAGGKGYNSSGSFCGGWAGHCGDGGAGSSNWYLICDRCRQKYLSLKRSDRGAPKSRKEAGDLKLNNMRSFNSPVTPKLASPVCETHQVMKENALFLLRLSSASEPVSISIGKRRQSTEFLTSSTTFECLEALGIQHNLYKQRLAEEHLTEDEIRAIQTGRPSQPDISENCVQPRLRSEDKPSSPSSSSPRSEFHRSVSIGWTDYAKDRVVMTQRKRATSTDSTGSPLLCQPSPALLRLVQIMDRDNTDVLLNIQQQGNRPPSTLRKQGSFQNCFPANRPVLAFVLQQHDLPMLTASIKNALRKVSCRTYALQGLTWLIRNVTQTIGLHDLMWAFVASLSVRQNEEKPESDPPENGQAADRRENDADHHYHTHGGVCLHPVSDLAVAGETVRPLQEAFHAFLQSVSDIMTLLPVGSALQQMAMRCFCLHFEPADHAFLHRGHVFSNISKILSRTDEESGPGEELILGAGSSSPQRTPQAQVEVLTDLTNQLELKASSRQAMIASLTDNSTETFWESGDEDRSKTKIITATSAIQASKLRVVYIHVDNCRDLGSKIAHVCFKIHENGSNDGSSVKIKSVDVDSRFAGWLSCQLPNDRVKSVKIELKGPDNTLRLRQVKILGVDANKKEAAKNSPNFSQIQQLNCEAETLRVFRLLTSQVFGKLICGGFGDSDSVDGKFDASGSQELISENGPGDSNDLREHMVGILFSRSSKLSHLQKQVCSHIVQAIRVEAYRVREEWEALLCSKSINTHANIELPSDAYCFEMLSMVLALSGSAIGRLYLAQQNDLMLDLFSLLHTGSARVQRQVTSLLRRVLPEIEPASLARLLGVKSLPSTDYIAANNKDVEYDHLEGGVLDVFLACIAKSLTVQTKIKGSFGGASSKNVTTVTLATAIHPRDDLRDRWWMRGCMSRKLAEVIIALVKDMAAGKVSDAWANVTKNAIAENIINLTRLREDFRAPNECLKTPTLWLGLASLCVLDQEHAERLSSSHWVSSAAGDQANGNQPQQPARPFCDNHDDTETLAIILCSICGNLCADCDRFLHLHRKTKGHQRQIFKEEEEAIKVDLHEGCGRTKLFWLMALADSKTLKAMVEFRGESSRSKAMAISSGGSGSGMGSGVCRFCGSASNTGLLAIGNVCAESECQEYSRTACSKTLPCGHQCGGVKDEANCLPCLHGCVSSDLKQDADDMCMICFTEALSCAPTIQLRCGHLFHLHCSASALTRRWPGPRITFAFSLCPICKAPIEHDSLQELLKPIKVLFEDVKRKALMRLEYEGLHRSETITTVGARFYQDPAGYAMERYAYYVCCKCEKAYYGGEARCDAEAGIGDDYDPNELVCGGCSDVSRAQMCPKHGTDFLEYKCRYCCSVAVFFCFGTTHFCNACHDDFQRVTNIPKGDLPRCPAGARAKKLEGEECPLHVKHPPTGEEFALGCGVCRNAHTF